MDMPRPKAARAADAVPELAAEPVRKAEIVTVADQQAPATAPKIERVGSPAEEQKAGVSWQDVEKALASANAVQAEKAAADLAVTKAELEAVKAELSAAKAQLEVAKSEPAPTAAPVPETPKPAAVAEAPKAEPVADKPWPKAELVLEKPTFEPTMEKIQVAAAKTAEPLLASEPVVVTPVLPPPVWDIKATDKTLKAAVERWASTSGWQISWELLVDYPVDATASITGSFEEAVEAVVKSMERAETPMKAIFYSGNKVLRIVAKGTE